MNFTDIAIDILLFIFVVDCALLCLVVLMQRSKQEGLGAAFGGEITSQFLGTGTSAFLVKATVVLAAVFFLTSIGLARLYASKSAISHKTAVPIMDQSLNQPISLPATNAAPATSTVTPVVAPAAASAPVTNAAPATTTTPPAKPR
jgi:preprotein translocase subunit SecG